MRYCLSLACLALLLTLKDALRSSHRSLGPRCHTSHGAALSYDKAAWAAGFTTCPKETAAVLTGGTGSLPSDLHGTYFRNGHAKFEVGKDLVMHPFDADGMVAAVTFANGQATFRNRFVATDGYRKERRYKRILFRGAFGTQRRGGPLANAFDLKNKNVANTNVVHWAGRLLALWEGGLPHKLEPDSLRTTDIYKFKGVLKKGDSFSAHPRIDAKSGRLVNFCAKQGGTGPSTVTVLEFAPGSVETAAVRTFQVPSKVLFFHDFIVTEKYYVFNEAPLTLDPLPFILGQRGPAECIKFDASRPANIYLVPRDASDPTITVIPVDAHFNFHFANAFDGDDGSVVFDVVKADKLTLGETSGSAEQIWKSVNYATDVAFSRLVRYTLKPPAGGRGGAEGAASGWTYSQRPLSTAQIEFPSVNPAVSCRQHRYIYASCGSNDAESTPVQGLIKIDTHAAAGGGGAAGAGEERWMPQPHEFLGETIFVPRAAAAASAPGAAPAGAAGGVGGSASGGEEDDGYLVSFLVNGQSLSTELVVFDAKRVAAGPVCRLPLPVLVPFGLHGSFAPGLVFDSESIIRRHKASLALESKQWGEMSGGFSGLGISYDMFDY